MAFLIGVIDVVFDIFRWVVIAHVIVSWVVPPYHDIRRFLDSLVQPLLDPVRRLVPPVSGLDLSPLVLLLILSLAQPLVIGLLVGLA